MYIRLGGELSSIGLLQGENASVSFHRGYRAIYGNRGEVILPLLAL